MTLEIVKVAELMSFDNLAIIVDEELMSTNPAKRIEARQALHYLSNLCNKLEADTA